jgi:hypothetical protein
MLLETGGHLDALRWRRQSSPKRDRNVDAYAILLPHACEIIGQHTHTWEDQCTNNNQTQWVDVSWINQRENFNVDTSHLKLIVCVDFLLECRVAQGFIPYEIVETYNIANRLDGSLVFDSIGYVIQFMLWNFIRRDAITDAFSDHVYIRFAEKCNEPLLPYAILIVATFQMNGVLIVAKFQMIVEM